mmetsp:Transcript_13777/g.33368  ORF Transcript_13777/g.33368 Transcript_13777/m.33368 type:complete len:227 (-) Transcript_13777:5862-6542(-)
MDTFRTSKFPQPSKTGSKMVRLLSSFSIRKKNFSKWNVNILISRYRTVGSSRGLKRLPNDSEELVFFKRSGADENDEFMLGSRSAIAVSSAVSPFEGVCFDLLPALRRIWYATSLIAISSSSSSSISRFLHNSIPLSRTFDTGKSFRTEATYRSDGGATIPPTPMFQQLYLFACNIISRISSKMDDSAMAFPFCLGEDADVVFFSWPGAPLSELSIGKNIESPPST